MRGSIRSLCLLALLAVLVSTATTAVSASGTSATGGGAGADPIEVVAPVAGALLEDFDPPARPWEPGHRGVALAAGPGAPVVAARAGVVGFSGEVAGAGWVTLEHGAGLETTYGVLDPRLVESGESVAAGDPLGLRAADAEHVHWGARLDGQYIHPLSLLAPWRVRLVPAGR